MAPERVTAATPASARYRLVSSTQNCSSLLVAPPGGGVVLDGSVGVALHAANESAKTSSRMRGIRYWLIGQCRRHLH